MHNDALVFMAVATALTLAVLAQVLRPLWRKPVLAVAAVAALSLTTLVLYRLVGTPAALAPATRQAPTTLEEAVAQLETRLRDDPRQVEGWRLLGQAYTTAGQMPEARDAYARAVKLAPDDPDVLVEAAESRALAAARRNFDHQAVAWLQHALEVQPRHQRARWFLGVAQRQAGKPGQAATTWEPLLAIVDAKTAVPLRAQIDDARNEAGLPPLAMPDTTASSDGLLQVNVRLDPKLAERLRLDGNAAVFVIARAPDGPPMPVAVEKHSAQELPLSVSLDDGDSPMPTLPLSGMQEVEVLARLSPTGNATPQPGDLESKPIRVQLPAKSPVDLVIDTARTPP